jgi:hypothetical protein
MAKHMARWGFANQIIIELKALGQLWTPKCSRKKDNVVGPGQKALAIHEMFLLGLRMTLDPTGPLTNRSKNSTSTLASWCCTRASLIGLKSARIIEGICCKQILFHIQVEAKKQSVLLQICTEASNFNFIDEKHI